MTSAPTFVSSMVLERGHLISVPNEGHARVLGIKQLEHDQFELTINEMHSEGVITVKATRDGRLTGEHALRLEEWDVVTLPGMDAKLIGAITRIREGRYQIRLVEKYVPSIVVDIDMSEPSL